MGADSNEEEEDEEDEDFVKADGGYRLFLSKKNPTGYMGVSRNGSKFNARCRIGAMTYLGTFDRAVDAAVAYARHIQSISDGKDEQKDDEDNEDDAISGNVSPMDSDGSDEQVIVEEAQGYTLLLSSKSSTSTGYLGVHRHKASGKFEARYPSGGSVSKYLGLHATAVDAAVAYFVVYQSEEDDGGNGDDDSKSLLQRQRHQTAPLR